MGLLDFLFGGKSTSSTKVESDRIWISQQAKFNGILKELELRSGSETLAIILVAHFDDTLERLIGISAEYTGNVLVTVTLAERLSTGIAARLNIDETTTVDLIVGERHPLLKVDDTLKRFADTLPCRCRLTHHLSLEDPLVKRIVGDRVVSILENLGMKDDEAIESDMVSRQFKKAQKRIQANALGNSKAASATEWMNKNLPNSFKM